MDNIVLQLTPIMLEMGVKQLTVLKNKQIAKLVNKDTYVELEFQIEGNTELLNMMDGSSIWKSHQKGESLIFWKKIYRKLQDRVNKSRKPASIKIKLNKIILHNREANDIVPLAQLLSSMEEDIFESNRN